MHPYRIITRLLLCATIAFSATLPSITPERYLKDVKFLASPELKGRGTGTPELEKAAQYIARHFGATGLQPLDGRSFFQQFTVTTNAHIGTHNRLEIQHSQAKQTLSLQQEYQPFNFSASGKVSGGVVFAGYGITAREYSYDDYAGLDCKDKVVLLLRHEPQEFDEKSVFQGKVYTEHAQFFSKAVNAKLHGARAVILINDVGNHPSDAEELEKFARTVGPGNPGIVFVQMKSDLADAWFAAAGKSLKGVEARIDQDLTPQSFAFPDSVQVHMSIDVQREVKPVHNVAGYLPGETSEYVVIGAHYDHLGLGEQFSMAPSAAGTAHPGADDNASGTAGVMELARYFTGQPRQKRGILFMAFAGEELGLLGSSYYVNHPKFPLDKAVAMINMDMIGRIRDGKVFIGGAGTGSTFKALIEGEASRYPLKLDYTEQAGYGSSDHTSFTTKQVPVLFFFSGLHADYHKPTDTWDKIDAEGASKLLELVADVTSKLANAAERPRYVRVAPPKSAHAATAGDSGAAASGYGPWFGSIPDFSEVPNGVRFADVTDGSPAGKAGLRGGDILTEFDGKPIQNLYDFTYALRSRKPGETVLVKVLRGSEKLDVKVLLEKRP